MKLHGGFLQNNSEKGVCSMNEITVFRAELVRNHVHRACENRGVYGLPVCDLTRLVGLGLSRFFRLPVAGVEPSRHFAVVAVAAPQTRLVDWGSRLPEPWLAIWPRDSWHNRSSKRRQRLRSQPRPRSRFPRSAGSSQRFSQDSLTAPADKELLLQH